MVHINTHMHMTCCNDAKFVCVDSPMFAGMDKNSPFCHWFKKFPDRLGTPTPKAILVVSAHWETSGEIRVTSQTQHDDLFFDYGIDDIMFAPNHHTYTYAHSYVIPPSPQIGGFPDFTYQLKYAAPGNPTLSKRVTELIKSAGFEAKEDKKRNFDHGVFVPLLLMYPEAKIPVVECSIFADLDPRVCPPRHLYVIIMHVFPLYKVVMICCRNIWHWVQH
jgi:aromatic ring-opening dioxygenase catalytic subunit (LigB family)